VIDINKLGIEIIGTTLGVSQIVMPYLGFVLNFNVSVMRDGIVRIKNELDE
jgi:hypothetical protein